MDITLNEMLETIRMVQMENLDIRTVTMGISLKDCADSDFNKMKRSQYTGKLSHYAGQLKVLLNK